MPSLRTNTINIKVIFFVILLLASLGQVSADLYLPSIPAIKEYFDTSFKLTQLTISVYMFGFSLSQLVYGPLSDGLGRRYPLLVGLSICIAGGFLCLFSSSIYWLILGRFLQGLGAGSGMALCRSIMRDLFSGEKLAKFGSYLSIGNIFLMASAPLVGGYLQEHSNWRVSFMTLLGYAIVTFIVVMFLLPETNKHRSLVYIRVVRLIKTFKSLVTCRAFVGYSACIFIAYGGVLAWVTSGPVILQYKLGFSPVQFGWIAVSVGALYAIGGVANAFLVGTFGIVAMVRTGLMIMLIAGLLMFSLVFEGIINSAAILLPIMVFILGTSFIFPNAFAGALTPFPKIAGFAGAIFGFMQIMGGALSSLTLSYLPKDNQMPLSVVFIALALLGLLFTRLIASER